MKVRIVKAGSDTFWYANHIGEIFEVEKSSQKYLEYRTLPREVHGDFYIDGDDVEIVEE